MTRPALALAMLLAVSAAVASLACAEAPVAEAPVFAVGDQWRWTGGGSRRVIAVEGDLIVTPYSNSRCSQCRAYRDRNLTLVKLVSKDGATVADQEIGYKMLDFPLTIGKKWHSDQALVNNATKVAEPYKNAFAVEAYEDVKTKAGTFKAFRITHVQERSHSSFSPDYGRSSRETLWYSPGAKAFVKREVNTARAGWGADWELESYVVK